MEEETIDLKELVEVLVKNIRKIGIITLICVIVAGIYLFFATPIYQSQTVLRIRDDNGIERSMLSEDPIARSANLQVMNDYAEILKSRSVVEPVIEATEEVNKEGMYPSYDQYIKNINTLPFKNTGILKLKVNATTAKKAQVTSKKIVESFISRLSNISRAEKENTRILLEERLKDAKKEMLANEEKLIKYKGKEHILTHYSEGPVNENEIAQVAVLGQIVELVDMEIAKTKLEIATSKARVETLNKKLGNFKNTFSSTSTTRQLRQKVSELELQKVNELAKSKVKNTLVEKLEKEIAATKEKLLVEYNKIANLKAPNASSIDQQLLVSKLENETTIETDKVKLISLEKLAKENNKKIENLATIEQEYFKVSRDAKVSQSIYAMLSKRLEEAKIAELIAPNYVQVIDEPSLASEPIKPRKGLTLVLAAILGLVISCGYFVAAELIYKPWKNG